MIERCGALEARLIAECFQDVGEERGGVTGAASGEQLLAAVRLRQIPRLGTALPAGLLGAAR